MLQQKRVVVISRWNCASKKLKTRQAKHPEKKPISVFPLLSFIYNTMIYLSDLYLSCQTDLVITNLLLKLGNQWVSNLDKELLKQALKWLIIYVFDLIRLVWGADFFMFFKDSSLDSFKLYLFFLFWWWWDVAWKFFSAPTISTVSVNF